MWHVRVYNERICTNHITRRLSKQKLFKMDVFWLQTFAKLFWSTASICTGKLTMKKNVTHSILLSCYVAYIIFHESVLFGNFICLILLVLSRRFLGLILAFQKKLVNIQPYGLVVKAHILHVTWTHMGVTL